jgi:hypothetical protein
VKTSFDGSPPKEDFSILDISIVSWVVMIAFFFLGRVFGGLRLL